MLTGAAISGAIEALPGQVGFIAETAGDELVMTWAGVGHRLLAGDTYTTFGLVPVNRSPPQQPKQP